MEKISRKTVWTVVLIIGVVFFLAWLVESPPRAPKEPRITKHDTRFIAQSEVHNGVDYASEVFGQIEGLIDEARGIIDDVRWGMYIDEMDMDDMLEECDMLLVTAYDLADETRRYMYEIEKMAEELIDD